MHTTDIARLFDRASDHRSAGCTMSSPDLDRYRPYVAHLDIPEARKDDMILAVHRIMQNAVDRAFGDDPVQRCGALADKAHEEDAAPALPVIDLDNESLSKKQQALNDVFQCHAIEENNKEEKS